MAIALSPLGIKRNYTKYFSTYAIAMFLNEYDDVRFSFFDEIYFYAEAFTRKIK